MGQAVLGAFRQLPVAPETVAAAWLGQAGWVLRPAGGPVVMIDPYLSDVAATTHGLRRVPEAPVRPSELVPDVLLVTHPHIDHLDPPTVAAYGRLGSVLLVGTRRTVDLAEREHGWAGDGIALEPGQTAAVAGLAITATFARHDEEGVDVGYRLDAPGVTIWHSGDTEYDARLLGVAPNGIDVALLPVNGSGGNMNAHEAALLAWQLDVGLAIPMHFGMWSDEDFASPFAETYRRLAPGRKVEVPRLGQVMVFDGGSEE